MKLVTAHKVLIRSAIGLGGLFSVWSGAMWFKNGDSSYAIVGVATIGATVALFVYLRNFTRKNPS